MPDVGETVDRYLIEALLGEGGMGRVYRALDSRLKRRVALKVLLPSRVGPKGQTDGSTRMLREARAAAAFNHPNVVAIYDVGEVDGNPFIAMELIEGTTLRTYVGDRGIDVAAKVGWLLDVARGLGAAHRAGLVHRDIKPDNVMVTLDGVVKILDFGIARKTDALAAGDAPPSVTPSNVVVGTPQYMAPEQIRGEPLDGRADQFAWGVMAYELISGSIPWDRATGLAVVAAVLSEETRPLSVLVPSVDPRLESTILRALMKSRDDRFATMDGLLESLLGRRSFVPPPSGDDVAFAPTTAQPVISSKPSPSLATPASPPTPAGTPAPTPLPISLAATEQAPLAPPPAPDEPVAPHPPRVTRSRVLAALAAGTVLAGGALAWHAAHTPKTTYCVTLDDTLDGPRCALPIDAERVARRYHSTARVTEVSGHTTRVEYVNFAGERQPREASFEDDDDLRRDVVRDDDGHVRAILTRDASGVLESHEKWSEDGKRIDFVDNDGVTPRHASDTARYTTVRRELDAHGRVVRELYFGPTGRPRTNEDGVYGKAIEYGTTWGARVKVTDLGADGAPAPRRSGASIVRATDDEVPEGRETTTYDVEGAPFASDGVFKKVRSWDATDVTRVAVFGLDGEPAVGLGASVHQIASTFNPTTHVQVFAYQDEHGKPQACRDRWFSSVRITQDARGRDVLVESLDADGNRTLVKDGIAAARCTYDESGNEIRREHLDPSGAPMTGSEDGYAREDLKHDAHGNVVEERFFDEHGEPAPLREGIAIRRTAYDDRDLPIAVSSFDVAEKLTTCSGGWASKHQRYDRLRNLVEVSYLGVDGKPTADENGVSVQRWTYDENDDLVLVAYFDVSGAPTMHQGDYASKRTTHDERGLAIQEDFLDVHGDPVLRHDGYATIKRTLDRNGDPILESYLGRRAEPVLRDGGYSQRKTTYDLHRRPIQVFLLDGTGPIVGSDGWAIERSGYDAHGLLVRVDHQDVTGRPKLDKAGRASWAKVYDARLNVTEEQNLGEDGKPIVARGGWATKKTTFDERDEVTEEALFGAAGEPVVGAGGWALHKLRHDDFGDVIEESFFDASHQATTLRDATYAAERSRFDDRRRLVEIAYLDPNGAPAKGPEGAAFVRYERDTYGRASRTTYLDGARVPTTSNDGKTNVQTTYDDAGRPVLEQFTNGTGAALLAADGCAGHRMRYDPQGHETERTCLDGSGEALLGAEGWAIRRTLHDARGNAVDEATYDATGAPRGDKTGVARTKRTFDARDRLREVAVFGIDGKPAHDGRGVHSTVFTYDEDGKQVGASMRDDHDRPIGPHL